MKPSDSGQLEKLMRREKRPWMLRSRSRFFVVLFVVLAVPTAALVTLVWTYIRKDLQRQAIDHNSLTARLVAQSVHEEFIGMQRFMDNFAHRTKLVEALNKREASLMVGKLNEMLSINPKFTRAFLTDTNGVLLADAPSRKDLVGKDFSDRDWFKGASKSEAAYVSKIYQRINIDKADAISVCVRVKNGSETIGYIAGQLTVDNLSTWLQAVKPSNNGLIELFDSGGTPALPAQTSHPEIHRFGNLNGTFPGSEGWRRMNDPLSGEESVITYVRVPTFGWTIIARQPMTLVFAPVEVLLRTILVFFCVCLAGTCLISFIMFDALTKYDDSRRRSEEALAKKARELKRSNDELEGMCYSIAHDLRAPLRAMRGFTSALIEDYNSALDATGQNFTHRIDEAAGRMDELIQDLLDYGKLGHVDLQVEAISLDHVMKRVIDGADAEIKQRRACVEVHQPMPNVLGNHIIIQQVLTNLVGNALKFVALGVAPQIKVTAELRGDKVRVSVRDNGIGIEPQHHQRIFGVFERLHSYETYPGTGIGLAIVRKGIERLGGTMGLESAPEKGSCFWFELPKA